MAKLSESTTPSSGDTNPNTTSTGSGINPSAPTVGTEGWGTTIDERQTLSPTDAEATRAGQMKGNPGDQQTEASSRMSAAATSANKPQTEREEAPLGNKRAAESTRGATALPNTNHGEADRTFAALTWAMPIVSGRQADSPTMKSSSPHTSTVERSTDGKIGLTRCVRKSARPSSYRNAA